MNGIGHLAVVCNIKNNLLYVFSLTFSSSGCKRIQTISKSCSELFQRVNYTVPFLQMQEPSTGEQDA